MAERNPGQMDITEQERTFAAFVTFAVRAVIVIFAVLVLLALLNA